MWSDNDCKDVTSFINNKKKTCPSTAQYTTFMEVSAMNAIMLMGSKPIVYISYQILVMKIGIAFSPLKKGKFFMVIS